MVHQAGALTPLPAEITVYRRGGDRRSRRAKTVFYSLFMYRRKGPRRQQERRGGYYVDLHEPLLLAIVLLTVLFCIADAFFTLMLLVDGGEELNPFMRVLIETDARLFFAVKFTLTAVGLMVAVVHKHFKLFRLVSGYQVLYGTFFLYLVLIKYEIGLLVAHDLML